MVYVIFCFMVRRILALYICLSLGKQCDLHTNTVKKYLECWCSLIWTSRCNYRASDVFWFNRVGQVVAALLRRLGLSYQGNESSGKIRINGLTMKRWFQPKLASSLSRKPGDLSLSRLRLGKEITHQQRNIRTSNLSLD